MNLLVLTFFFQFLHSYFSQTITGTYLYQDLLSTSTTAFASEVSAWSKSAMTSPYYYTCNSVPILGGYGIGGTFSRTYNTLPTHAAVLVSMSLYILDDWVSGDKITITVGSYSVTLNNIGRTGTTSPYSSNICGNPSYKDLGIIKVRAQITHSSSSISVSFTNTLTYGNSIESWGVRDLSLKFLTSSTGISNYACFLTPSGVTSSSMCNCQNSNQYYSSSCQTCNSMCSGCISSSTSCFSCASNYYFTGTTCSICPSNCDTCSSSTVCTKCSSGYYLYSNGQCYSYCNSPMTISSSPVDSCISPCTSTQYLYWDGSCSSTCASPLTTSTNGTDKICNYGCTSSQYLYWDGSCASSCPSPLTSSTILTKNLCTFTCSAPNSFLLTNQTCSSICSSPFYQTTVKTKTICNEPCASGLYYFQNGSCLSTCPAPYNSYTLSSVKYCNNPCSSSLFYYQNGSCLSTCVSPFISYNISTAKFCNAPCSSGDYYYLNGSCLSTCSNPYSFYTSGLITYCSINCLPPKYLYDNLTCLSSCPSPFTSSTDGTIDYCGCDALTPYYLQNENLCNETCSPLTHYSTTQGSMQMCIANCTGYIYSNDSCLSTCNTPFTIRTVGAVLYCDFPCAAGELYFYQGTCVTNCTGIYASTSYGVESYCNPPCTKSQYLSDQGLCDNSCLSPLVTTNDNGYKWCSTPCANPLYPYTLRNGTCVESCSSPWFENSDYQYPMCDYACNHSEYLTASGGCTSTCDSPFTSISGTYYPYCDSPCQGSTPYFKLDTQTCTSSCNSPYIEDPNSAIKQCILMTAPPSVSTQITGTTTTATSVSSSIRGSVGAAGGGGASAFGLVTMNRFLFYTRYLQIGYPQNLIEYYIQANSTSYPSLGFSIPKDGLQFPPYRPIPQAFEGWGLNSSFIANYWQTFSTICITLGIGITLWILQKIFKRRKKKELAFFFEKIMYIFRWNFALIQFCTGYDSIMLYASCEFRTYSLDDTISIISFASAVFCCVLVVVFLVLTFLLAREQYKVKQIRKLVGDEGALASMKDINENDLNPLRIFMRNWQGFHILFGGYKDNTAFARGFIFFFMIRNILWILTLSLLYEYPLIQISIMCGLSYLMLFMMLKNRPFVNLISKFEIPFAEFIISYVNTNILILAVMDHLGIEDSGMRTTLGSMIIYGFIIFGMNAFICMGLYFILGFYIGYKKYKEMKSSGSVTFISLITIPFVSYGMDFDEFEAEDHRPVKLTIQRDPKTKELTIVKNRIFLPLFKLLRKSEKVSSLSTQSGSPTNKSILEAIQKNPKNSTLTRVMKPKKTQIVPEPTITQKPKPIQPHHQNQIPQHHVRTDTEALDLLQPQSDPDIFKFDPIEIHHHHHKLNEDLHPTDAYDFEDKYDEDEQFEDEGKEQVKPEENEEERVSGGSDEVQNHRDQPVMTPKDSQRAFLSPGVLRLPRPNMNSSFYSERVEKGSTSARDIIPGMSDAGDMDDSIYSERGTPVHKFASRENNNRITSNRSKFGAPQPNFSFVVENNQENKKLTVLIRKKQDQAAMSEADSHTGARDIHLVDDF